MERALARRPRLAQRLFTAAELEYAARKARPAQHLAARFCAKEAVAKALGVEVWSPLEVEVVPTATGPQIRLSGRLAELGVEVQVSLTHSRGMAGAVAVAN